MKIRILALIFALCLLFSFSACSSNENKIFINGNVEWSKENIENALIKANKAGAETTQFLGAIKL